MAKSANASGAPRSVAARVLWLFVATALSVACSSTRSDDGRSYVDASPAAPVQPTSDDPLAREVAGAVEKALVAKPELAARFAANGDGFQLSRDGVTSPGWRGAWNERAFHVGARLPEVASKPFEAGVGVSELYRLRLEQVGAREVALGLADGRAVYRDLYPSTDVTFVASPERLEWAYTLRDEKAPREFALKVTLPKNLPTARVDAHGAIEFLDADGTALLRAPRPIAADAAGTLRDASLTWDAGVLTVRLDTRDLQYPIVLDPAIETFVWQARVQPPVARAEHVTVYDSVRKRIVIFGGSSATGAAHADTWEWDGVVWSLRATTGPSGRFQSAFAFDGSRGVAVMYGGFGAGSPGTELWEWDGTTWFQRCTAAPCTGTRPSARSGAAMAWDPVSGKCVLFGGWSASATVADTWTWDGTAWASLPISGPSARQLHAMTYDTTGARVLLFGGSTGAPGAYLNDLWSFNGSTWSPVTTVGTPPAARRSAAFTFRSANGKALLFGGDNGSTIFGDTFELDSASNTWSAVASAGSTARKGISAAYDANRQVVAMFGGDYSGLFADTWEFKAGKWYRPAGEIGARRDSSTAWDSWRNRIVLFGGYGPGFTRYNDTWEWTGYGWTEACTTSACIASRPLPRSGSAAAFDSIRRKFVIFGGATVGTTDETWEFDGDVWVRKCTTSPCNTNMPTIRTESAAAFDAKRGKVVLFGGWSPYGGGDDTWEWDGNVWTRVCTAAPCSTNIPAARRGATATYDAGRGKVVLFGGQVLSGTTLHGDTWEYDGSTWVRVATTGPVARVGAKIAYDEVREKVVLFGGGAASSLGDTWEWNGVSWTQTGSSGPPARSGHSLEYDATRRRIVAFGGGGSAAIFGDTWEYYTRGGACSLGADCATGFCVDGVCCEQLSCGTCQACNTTGSPGNCAPVASADDPDSCPAATSSCDATGACKKKQGQACTASTQCASGSCANGYCCNAPCTGGCDVCNVTPGTCTVLAKGATGVACGAYFCDGSSGECPTSCLTDTDCGSGYYCAAGGICQARRAQGLSCNVGTGGDCSVSGCRQCNPGLTCKDGYCCNGTCDGSCRTCAATPGTCTNVASKDDPDTCSGTMTCSSGATCLKQNGQTCAAGTECATGNCVDGVCCNSACAGGCDVCNATAGTCTIAAQGSAGASPGCGAYVCNGSTAGCPTTCGNDADCASTHYCAASGTCQLRKANGATCNMSAGVDCRGAGCRVCASNNCIDGYCCDTACGGSCDACNGGALGWSGAVNGTCAIAPVSHPGSPSCGTYACNGASATCATGCTSDAQCGAGFYCNAAGACVAQKAQGLACNLTTDCKVSGSCRACATGNCVDGYCCNSACGSQCQACDVAGALGTCITVTGAVHVNPAISARTACPGSGQCGATCNGTDATTCHYAGASTACGSASCAAGIATNAGTCNGSGTCLQSTTPCGAYACDVSSCRTSCTLDSHCASSGYYCAGGSCQAKKPNGDACTGASACQSGNCVSGVCCDTACTGAGLSCAVAGSIGKCAKVNGTACASAAECGSGRCVDGVCCDSACTGQCQACNVAGSAGTCTNVVGAPVGGRAACGGTGAGTACGARCDGTSGSACAYPTATTSCSSASCASGVESTAGTCNGAGGCSFTTKPCGAYLCGASSCKSTCGGDTDCASGFYCKLGACAPKEVAGASCTNASACASGSCVDGVCCSSATCGSGQRCNVPGALGKCAKPNGIACTVSTECGSGFCVDGVCCDTSCSGQCAACDVTGKVGTCSAVTGDPRGGRPACAGTGAGGDCGPRCNGVEMTSCRYPGSSTSCGGNACTLVGDSYIERHQSSCNGAGACQDVPKTCVGFVCGATACKTTCGSSADCSSGYYCKTGACVPIEGLGTACTDASTCTSGFCTDGVCCASASCGTGRSCSAGTGTLKGMCIKLNGTECSANAECASGACVDGVCCDSACNGPCEACNRVGSIGKCVPITGYPLAGHPSCTGKTSDPFCGQRCDGSDGAACKYPGASTACGSASCGGGEETQVSTCDAAGSCKIAKKGCAPYVCGPTACLSGCTSNADCASGNYCKAGACVKVEGLGVACSNAAECASGFCADGVCCSFGSCGEGSSCAAADSTTPGVCLKKKGVACTKADECATGRCVDGFCCDLACNGQCEACDVSGSEGTCTPVVGAPHAARATCDDKAADDCAKAQCDGKTRDKCGGFKNGATVACGVASCTTDKRFQKAGTCDGAGGCAFPDPKPCTPYACDAAASSGCKSSCTGDPDCAEGFSCQAGACVQGAKCSEDRLSSIDKAGTSSPCTPYRCGSDGTCLKACATSDDCAPGTVCDATVKACVGVAAATEDDGGGCAIGSGSSPRSFGAALAALLLAGVLRRRSRRGASARGTQLPG